MNLSAIYPEKVKNVFLVTGWQSVQKDYSKEIAILEECYPNANVSRFLWDANGSWSESLEAADRSAVILLKKKLDSLTAGRAAATVLVGHSLGARVIIHALAASQSTVHHVVLMGAAINKDDPAILLAVNRTKNGLIHLYNSLDVMLNFYQFTEEEVPMGLGKISVRSPKLLQIETLGLFNKEESGIIKVMLPVLARIAGGPIALFSVPLAKMFKSSHSCLRYMSFYEHRLSNGDLESFELTLDSDAGEFIAGMRDFMMSMLMQVKKSIKKGASFFKGILQDLGDAIEEIVGA